MSRPKTKYLILDTETAPPMTSPLVYDLGMKVIDKTGKTYARYSFVIADTFLDMADICNSAYYAWKFPAYQEEIDMGKRKVVSWDMARMIANALIAKWQVRGVCAYNAEFDKLALDSTMKRLNKSGSFFQYNIDWWDIWTMAHDTVCNQKLYKEFCIKNGFLTKHKVPQIRRNAETVYRYMKQQPDFIESHTGAEDTDIEAEIFAYCFRQHKAMRHSMHKLTKFAK